VAAFHAATAAYWQRYAESLLERMSAAAAALGFPTDFRITGSPETPPEPPVGARYLDPDGSVAFNRADDGWHCDLGADVACRSCPTTWGDLWRDEVGEAAMSRKLRKGYDARPLTLALPDEPPFPRVTS
jgi:hypothetical protein